MRTSWAPKVCKIMAFMAIIMGLRLLFYILLGFRLATMRFSVRTVGGISEFRVSGIKFSQGL